ncbi:hypothetical protein PSR1_03289 [Anaeromyxobacter sp. PSR-1]|nr:hypothetical protein PSR1_03289 [Anaeromyxobacter sp. PSR-1]
MTCSAFSFGSARSSASSAWSSAASAPRRRVPAMGRSVTSPSSSFTSVSGDEPTSARGPSFTKNRYGEGFTRRSAR